MKKLIFILYIFLAASSVFAQTGVVGVVTTHTKTGVEDAPPIPGTYDLYVDDSGSDANPGSQTEPVASINRAAQLAQPGDVVGIMGGTYRETIVPLNSGTSTNRITYEGIPGQTVIISGLTDVGSSGWTVHSGSIYKKTITLPVTGYNNSSSNNTTLLANQIFKDVDYTSTFDNDDAMQFEARWPNITGTSADLFDRDLVRPIWSGGGGGSTPTSTTIVDASAPASMTGATLWLNGWYITFGTTVTSHSGSTITFTPSQGDVKKRKYYYLTNKLSLLDVEKEWHYEGGILYYRQPGGGSPTGLEYKARNYGFDLTGKSYITIHNIKFIGCNPVQSNNNISGSTATSNVIIDNIRGQYINHAVRSAVQSGTPMNTVYFNPEQTGIKLIGPDNLITNSELKWGASQAIWLGERGQAVNNLIEYFAYDGSFGSIMPWGLNTGSSSTSTHNQKIMYNTIRHMGRSCIDFGHNLHGSHLNIELGYNDMWDYGKLNTDLGALYVGHFTNTTGLVTHHNWIHDVGAPIDDGSVAGIYYDQGSGPSLNHHNVLWNNYPATEIAVGSAQDYFATPNYEDRNAGPSRIENNTLASIEIPGIGQDHSYKTSVSNPVDQQRNNIYADNVICCGFSTTAVNVTYSVGTTLPTSGTNNSNSNPLFLGTGTGGLVYRLQSGSPAKDQGTTITGITTGNVGTPDKGAYEYGGTEWVPGYVEVPIIPVSGDNDLDALGSVSPITIAFNTSFGTNGAGVGLPSTVSCTFDDASTGAVGLTWAVGTYSQLGSPYTDAVYTLVGTPIEAGGVTNDDNLTVTCDVTVQDMFQNITSTIEGIWSIPGMVINTNNNFGTLNASGDITLWKSLAPGPTGRDYTTENTPPKLVANYADMLGTGCFTQATVNTNMDFNWLNATAANLKWTEIIALMATDQEDDVGIAGSNGRCASCSNGISLRVTSVGTAQNLIAQVSGNAAQVIGATVTSGIVLGTPGVVGFRIDNSLAAGSKVKGNRGNTEIATTSTGSFVPDTAPAPTDKFDMGDCATEAAHDLVGRLYYRVSLSGVSESDAVIDKLITDIAAVCGITP